jgi:hypothetical protein
MINLSLSAKQTSKHKEHLQTITACTWTVDSQKFVTGDIEGSTHELVAKPGLFQQSATKFVKEKCEIFQLYPSKDAIIMSSFTRAILINTVQKQLQVVGTKPREGKFGACFHFTPTRGEKEGQPQSNSVTV